MRTDGGVDASVGAHGERLVVWRRGEAGATREETNLMFIARLGVITGTEGRWCVVGEGRR